MIDPGVDKHEGSHNVTYQNKSVMRSLAPPEGWDTNDISRLCNKTSPYDRMNELKVQSFPNFTTSLLQYIQPFRLYYDQIFMACAPNILKPVTS